MDTSAIELSERYYRFVEEFTKSDFENEKLLGKFYTDYEIAESMTRVIINLFCKSKIAETVRIIDPFCGDGRLVKILMRQLAENLNTDILYDISLWDIDKEAVKEAEKTIRTFCEERGLNYRLESMVADAFVEYKKASKKYNICITNPPWSLLKPQKIFNKNNDEQALIAYREAIELYDGYMLEEFGTSQPSSKFGKWGTNLARCGVEVALRLIDRTGFCGLVSPASLLNDQVSGRLRQWIFDNYKVEEISYYPAELKLYGNADIASVTMVVSCGETDKNINLKTYDREFNFQNKNINKAIFTYIKNHGYGIPLKTGVDSIPIMMKLESLPTTLEYCKQCGLSFTRELDETRVKEKLRDEGRIEFAKGYMVDRYSFHGDGMYLNEALVLPPKSAMQNKVVWRDVSRDSQARRIKATILPPGYICGNSLGVICGDDKTIKHQKILLAIMNSTIYEYQARSMLVSNHVAAGIIKQIRVPMMYENDVLISFVDRQLHGENLESYIDVEIAKLYEISLNEYAFILKSLNIDEAERLLEIYATRNEEKKYDL